MCRLRSRACANNDPVLCYLSAEKDLYEHQQEMLEKHTEQLSELTESDTATLSEEQRSHIVNLTRVTERFMSSMLNTMKDALDNGTGPLRTVTAGSGSGAPVVAAESKAST